MARVRNWVPLVATAAWLLLVATAPAQQAATVAEADGAGPTFGTIGTAPASQIEIGSTLSVGQPLITASGSRVLLVLGDGSVVAVGPSTEVEIAELRLAPATPARTRLRLQRGAIRAVVSPEAGAESRFQVDTPTGLARARGTEFLVTFDPVADVSQVVGISGTAAVHSVLDPAARGVLVTAGELTSVPRGRYPTPPQKLTETVFRQYLDSLAFIGGGKAEGLAAVDPLLAGAVVPPPDQAGAAAAALMATFGERAVAAAPYPESLIDQTFREANVFDTPAEAINGELGIEF